MSEQDLVNTILDWLRYHGAWAVRINSGAVPIESEHSRRLIRMAPAGTPDILAIWPGGLGIAIEAKLPGNKPTAIQATTIDQIRETGGLAVVAYSIDDVEQAINERIRQCQK